MRRSIHPPALLRPLLRPALLGLAAIGIAGCAQEPAKPAGIFDLSSGLDRGRNSGSSPTPVARGPLGGGRGIGGGTPDGSQRSPQGGNGGAYGSVGGGTLGGGGL